MDFHNKKVRRVFAVIIMIIIVAMVLTSILPLLV